MAFQKRKPQRKPLRNPKRRRMTLTKNVSTRMNLKTDTYAFTRRMFLGTIVGNAAYNPYLQCTTIQLGQLPGVTDFTNLFDRYMITYVKVRYHLKIDPSAQVASAASFPKLYYLRDYDDSNAPASLDEMRQHSKVTYRVMNPNKPITFGFRPATLAEVYRSPLTTSYSPKWNQWIDMADTTVPHFGWKIGVDDFTNTNYRCEVEAQIWFKCKDIR